MVKFSKGLKRRISEGDYDILTIAPSEAAGSADVIIRLPPVQFLSNRKVRVTYIHKVVWDLSNTSSQRGAIRVGSIPAVGSLLTIGKNTLAFFRNVVVSSGSMDSVIEFKVDRCVPFNILTLDKAAAALNVRIVYTSMEVTVFEFFNCVFSEYAIDVAATFLFSHLLPFAKAAVGWSIGLPVL